MYELIVGGRLAERAVQNIAGSALPNAPIVIEPEPHVRTVRIRLGLAAALHHAADKLTPAVCTSA